MKTKEAPEMLAHRAETTPLYLRFERVSVVIGGRAWVRSAASPAARELDYIRWESADGCSVTGVRNMACEWIVRERGCVVAYIAVGRDDTLADVLARAVNAAAHHNAA